MNNFRNNYKKMTNNGHIISVCYIAYGTSAKLKANSIIDTVLVVDELECKAECSRARETGKFRCATFSYWYWIEQKLYPGR